MPNVKSAPRSLRELLPYLAGHRRLRLVRGEAAYDVEYRGTTTRDRMVRIRLRNSVGRDFQIPLLGCTGSLEVGLEFEPEGFTASAMDFGGAGWARFEYLE